jgi:hypothetical protein
VERASLATRRAETLADELARSEPQLREPRAARGSAAQSALRERLTETAGGLGADDQGAGVFAD